jgi:protein TonB
MAHWPHATLPAAPRKIGAAVALAMHALAAAALLSYEPARSALAAAAPLMVDLIVPPKPEPVPERPVEIVPPKPKPRPVVKPRPKPPEPPLVRAPEQAPAQVSAPPPPEPAPEPQPVVTAPPAPPPPVAVTAPIFNADYLKNPPPAYPALSRRIREEGVVVLRVLVSTAGTAQEVQVRESSGHRRLDDAAREAVQRWRFVPAKRGEEPIAAWVLVPVSFKLEG